MSSATPAGGPADRLSIAIIGNDVLVEALPARPIQFAHACEAAGFDVVLPESWGDELVAETVLQKLEGRRHDSPAVLCACPIVRKRLLASGVDLAPLLVTSVAPPVAAAEYARVVYGERVGTMTYVGNCPAGAGPEFDAQYHARDFLALLRERGIDPLAQPTVYDAVLPPDRRRYESLPGGCPSAEAIWQRCQERALIELEGGDLAIDLAQYLLTRRAILIDVAPALGCSCSGVTGSTTARSARVAVMSLEPPRATGPVVEPELTPSLDAPVDALRDDPIRASHSWEYEGSARRATRLDTPDVPTRTEFRTEVRLPPRGLRTRIAVTPPEALDAIDIPDSEEP